MSADETTKHDIIHRINDKIMEFKYYPDMNTAPGVHVGLNPCLVQMQKAVYNLHRIHIKARRQKMRELLIQDFLRESEELGEVQFGYINTQP